MSTLPIDGIHRECTLAEIAERLGYTSDWIRQIEAGALAKLKSNPRARELFGELLDQVPDQPPLDLVPVPRNRVEAARFLVAEVAQIHGVPVSEIYGRRRTSNIATARREAMRCVRELGFSYPEIGQLFDRDHTTVMRACGALGERGGRK